MMMGQLAMDYGRLKLKEFFRRGPSKASSLIDEMSQASEEGTTSNEPARSKFNGPEPGRRSSNVSYREKIDNARAALPQP